MVGGPLANDLFWDWRDDWVQTEIALDYNAAIPGIAAMQVSYHSRVLGYMIWWIVTS